MPTDIAAASSYSALPASPIKAAASLGIIPASQGSIAAAVAAAPHPSPVSLLDPKSGIVVLEFYNAKGDETQSLPTKRQLKSYELNEPSNGIYQPAIHDVATPLLSITGAATGSVTGAPASAGTTPASPAPVPVAPAPVAPVPVAPVPAAVPALSASGNVAATAGAFSTEA
ncbi:hypothetical protein [Acidisphaera sp. L21]|uniref:hypothetical protein n=1 Tax=Acidisphaera sp. L21 TaxID=1641851 RepID=UPI00131B5DB7|nr:hypothetical protein [Acidisphaera sp. L21]